MPTTNIDHETEVAFARWITNLGGWMSENRASGDDVEARTARTWLLEPEPRMARGTRDGRTTLELTDAGRAWCQQNAGVR
jgi:hypothetical protein